MSVIIHTRGEAGGGVAAHLHCSHCGHFSKSHAQQLSHMAAAHPSCLDEEVVGRLGTILMYQSTARLFHCSICFFTCKDFTKLYKHIISKHCMDHREGGDQGEEEMKVGDGGEEEEEEEKMGEEGEEKMGDGGEEEEEKKMGDGGEEGEEEKNMGEEGEEEKKMGEQGEEEKKMGDGGEEGEEEKKMGDGGEEGEEEKKMGEEGEEEKKMGDGGEEGEEEKKMGDGGEEGEEEKKMGDGGEEGEEEKKMGEEGEEEKKMGEEGEEKKKMGEEGEEEALKRRRSSEEEVKDVDGPPREMDSEKPDGEGEENVLTYDGSIYRCLICGCRNKLKVVSVNHVMKKHDIPKAYASQAIRRDVVTLRQTLSSTPEEDEAVGMTGELLNEEMRAMAKLVNFTSNRFVCLVCGWKTKLKGFVLSHVARSHDVERPYGCQICSSSFFLPSRLQQHVRTAHRPGRYACPFCCFRSHYLGGFRRHCSRCNAREGGEPGRAARVGGHQEHKEGEEGEEDKKKTRAGRKRRMTRKVMEEQEEDE